jgi:hypothetical protein
MGLMRWLRGGDDNSASAGVISAGLAEIDGLFRPTKHKQTEHVQQMKRKRVDLATATGAAPDLSAGVAAIKSHKRKRADTAGPTPSVACNETPANPTRQTREVEAVRRARAASEERRARRETRTRRIPRTTDAS